MPCETEVNEFEPISTGGGRRPARQLPDLRLGRIILIACILVSLLYFFLYVRLTRMIDHRLAEGPFSTSTDILAAPRTVAVGEPLAREELVQSLQQS